MKRTDKNCIGNVEDEKKRKISGKIDCLSTSGSGIASNQSSDNEEDQENSESENEEDPENSESENEEDYENSESENEEDHRNSESEDEEDEIGVGVCVMYFLLFMLK